MNGPDGRRAVLKTAKTPRIIILGEGERLDGWQIKSISPGEVKLMAGTHEASIAFPKAARHP
jgi:hypothetical protein